MTKRTILGGVAAALMAGTLGATLGSTLGAGVAGAQTTETAPVETRERETTKDRTKVDFPEETFEEERRITRIVQDVYGEGVEQADGERTDEAITEALQVGNMLPEAAEAEPVEDKLAERLPPETRWMAVGEHLVGLGPDGRITSVYHDLLP